MAEPLRVPKDRIRERASADPIGTYEAAGMPAGVLRRSGASLKANCPLHDDGTPSFVVFPDGKWRCFGCGKHGDVLDFFMLAHRSGDFGRACDGLGALLSVCPEAPGHRQPLVRSLPTPQPEPDPIPWALVDTLHSCLLADEKRLDWHVRRKGLTLDIITDAQIGLGSGPAFRGQLRYLIPIMDMNDVSCIVDLRAYRPGGKPKMLSWERGRGGVKLYPWPWVCDLAELVWCEGEIDCLNLIARGIPAVTATNGVDGALNVTLPDLSGKRILVAGDNDEAGSRLNRELPERLHAAGASTVSVMPWDEVIGHDAA